MISTEQLRKTIEECTQKRPSGQSVVFASKFVEALARDLLANRESWPVYQYRMRNPYNGQVTGWETIAASVEFRIIAASPAPALQKDVEAVVGLLESGEWAEHCTNTELGQRLESAVTALMNNAPSAPEVSGE
ncbi:hypothetical protein G5643_08705 [Serratia marcescens]|uniref:hypothetical protein n=1 Tax=Serratia marcescens TaxID=615 RepID=UPI0013DA1317|nr:hypothetical protein [Serratia marcescens]NGH08786.1 hypothetical protein [Serratia marcescens]